MKRAFLIPTCTLAFGAMSAYGAEFKGVISDSMCGAKHVDATEKSMACVKKCVKDGDEAVFITSDDKVLTIDKASQAKVAPHLGHKVTVTGTVTDGSLKIDSIKM
jgi:hypothetical protein